MGGQDYRSARNQDDCARDTRDNNLVDEDRRQQRTRSAYKAPPQGLFRPPCLDRFFARFDAELGDDLGDVPLRAIKGDIQALRNFTVGAALADEGEDLFLPRRERLAARNSLMRISSHDRILGISPFASTTRWWA